MAQFSVKIMRLTGSVLGENQHIELQFKNLSKEMGDIKRLLEAQNVQTEKRFTQIEKDIDELRLETARYKTIWGIGSALGATLAAFFLNRLF